MKRIARNNKKSLSSNPVSSALIIVIPCPLSLSVHCTSHYYHKITPQEKEKPHLGSLNMTRGHMTITQGRRFQELSVPTISPDEISPIVKSYEVDRNRSTDSSHPDCGCDRISRLFYYIFMLTLSIILIRAF